MKGIEGKIAWFVIVIIIAILCYLFLTGIITTGIKLFGEGIRITVVGLINFIATELGLPFIHFE